MSFSASLRVTATEVEYASRRFQLHHNVVVFSMQVCALWSLWARWERGALPCHRHPVDLVPPSFANVLPSDGLSALHNCYLTEARVSNRDTCMPFINTVTLLNDISIASNYYTPSLPFTLSHLRYIAIRLRRRTFVCDPSPWCGACSAAPSKSCGMCTLTSSLATRTGTFPARSSAIRRKTPSSLTNSAGSPSTWARVRGDWVL